MRRIALIVVAAILLAGVYALLHRTREHVEKAGPAMPLAPQLSFVDLGGHSFSTSEYKGKVLLVNFWAAWCGPCTAEIPQFIAMQQKYGPQRFQLIGISIDDDERELRAFCARSHINYPIVIGNQKITDAFGGVLGLPTTFIIGRDGKIHGKQVGVTEFAALERQIAPLLQSKAE
jgi:thiol-disulfide isomerase/thioredoxin